MPIYAYKCASCGFAKDVLQKVSDTPLSVCPECGEQSFNKQITAAGFQLKGSGWYATDFRGGSGSAAKPDDKKPADAAKSTSSDSASSDSKPAAPPKSGTPSASAGGCGASCACH